MLKALRAVAIVAMAVLAAFVLWRSADTRAQVPDSASRHRQEYVRIVRSEWGLSAPVASLAAQIHQESGWNCRAVSKAGARGCAQFMPATGAWIGDVDNSLREGDLFSPPWAFRAQAVYMRWLHDRVKGSVPCERMGFAMQAYNSGLGWVYKRQKLSPDPRRCFDAACDINPGVLPANQREAQEYPVRILLRIEPKYLAWGPGACS